MTPGGLRVPVVAVAAVLAVGQRAAAQQAARVTPVPPQRFVSAPRYENLAGRAGLGLPLALGHMDRDRDLDVIFGNAFSVTVLHNRGDATFRQSVYLFSRFKLGLVHTLDVGDLDGDGDLDVVVGRSKLSVPARLLVFLNDGRGGLREEKEGTHFPSVPMNTLSLALADLDGDGDLDVVTGEMFAQNRLFLNDGKGRFRDATSPNMPGDGAFTHDIGVADLDADGDLDLVLANGATTDQNMVYFNDGKARFTPRLLSGPSGNPRSVAIGDVDGDGDLDLVIGYLSQQDRLYLNDGKAGFQDATHRLPFDRDWTTDVALGDVDGDGDLDVVAGLRLRIYLNDGHGRFVDQSEALMPFKQPSANLVELGDLDHDGDLDVVLNGSDPRRRWDRLQLKVFVNLTRQVYTQPRVEVGGRLGLLLFADGGELAYPILGLGTARISLGPLGTMGVDPRTAIALPPVPIPSSRMATLRFALPPDPRLRGRTLRTQALTLDPSRIAATAHLTNWMTDVVR